MNSLPLPVLRPDQWEIAKHPAKVKILSMGRRWGKTVLGGVLSMATASQGGKVAWVVPSYKNGRTPWRWSESVTAELRQSGKASSSKTDRVIEFSNGGYFGIYSAENEDAIRGDSFHLVVLDEAARIAESAWTEAIQPTLADYDGDAVIISTPKGLNWFYREWVLGRETMGADIAAWKAPSYANPNPRIQAAYLKAKARVTKHVFDQEWNADFVTDGSFFQKVDERATITEQDTPEQHKGHYLGAGLDWAMSEDYTVLTIACRNCNRAVAWDRFNQIDYTYQRARIVDVCKRWGINALLPERNSIGQPNIELLEAAGLPIARGMDGLPGFNTTATSKPALIQKLASGLEHDGFIIPVDYADELKSYEVITSASGHAKFSAPAGYHDDRVMSLALAWWAITGIGGVGL